jgi:hypothetical protein
MQALRVFVQGHLSIAVGMSNSTWPATSYGLLEPLVARHDVLACYHCYGGFERPCEFRFPHTAFGCSLAILSPRTLQGVHAAAMNF